MQFLILSLTVFVIWNVTYKHQRRVYFQVKRKEKIIVLYMPLSFSLLLAI